MRRKRYVFEGDWNRNIYTLLFFDVYSLRISSLYFLQPLLLLSVIYLGANYFIYSIAHRLPFSFSNRFGVILYVYRCGNDGAPNLVS